MWVDSWRHTHIGYPNHLSVVSVRAMQQQPSLSDSWIFPDGNEHHHSFGHFSRRLRHSIHGGGFRTPKAADDVAWVQLVPLSDHHTSLKSPVVSAPPMTHILSSWIRALGNWRALQPGLVVSSVQLAPGASMGARFVAVPLAHVVSPAQEPGLALELQRVAPDAQSPVKRPALKLGGARPAAHIGRAPAIPGCR